MTAFSHVAFCVSDLTRSMGFYQNVFGFRSVRSYTAGPEFENLIRLRPLDMTGQFLKSGNLLLELIHFAAPVSTETPARQPMNVPGFTHLSFVVSSDEEFATVTNAVRQWGGRILEDTRTNAPGTGLFVFCEDPDGIRIEVYRPDTD